MNQLSEIDFDSPNLDRQLAEFKLRFLGQPLNPELEGAGLVAYRQEALAEPYAQLSDKIGELTTRLSRQPKDAYRRVKLGPLQQWYPETIVRFGPFAMAEPASLQVPFTRLVGVQERPRYVCYSYSVEGGVAWCRRYKSKWANPEKEWGHPRPLAEPEVAYWLNWLDLRYQSESS